MEKKWYQKTNIQASIIAGVFVLLAALVPVFKNNPGSVKGDDNKVMSNVNTGDYSPPIQTGNNSPINLTIQKTEYIKDKALRKLMPLETGKDVSRLPNGVYGYAIPYAIAYKIKYPEMEILKLSNKKQTPDYFEVQKVNDQCFVIGYIGDESFSNIINASPPNSEKISLFPVKWGSMKNIVSISFNSILKVDAREIDIDEMKEISILDIVTTSVITDVYKHNKN